MDEVGFLKLCVMFVAAVGKKDWDSQPNCGYGFEEWPVIWLLDGHYSHKYCEALDYLEHHDVHVFFTASGASEVDQVAL